MIQFWTLIRFILLLGLSYLLGSIPSGFLAGKWIKGIDLRKFGSGTVSSSMVWEHVTRWAVVPVGLFDIFKGALPTWVSLHLGISEGTAALIGLVAVIGHNWPIYLNFHGGRGFSPFLGILLVLFPFGAFLLLVGLGIGNLSRSPAVPLFIIIITPLYTFLLGSSSTSLWLFMGMLIITVAKRLEANRRPLPIYPKERRRVIFYRIFLDRDILD